MAGAKSYFIPHEGNGHWPHLLAHHHLAAVSALLIFLKVAAVGIVALTPTAAHLSTITTNRIIQLTNDERKKVGASALTVNAKLLQAAEKKGKDMLANQYFAHISPSGVTPWFWIKQTGYSYSVAGENLAIDFVDAEHVVTAWLNSPSHKENMLNKDYTETGVAVVSGTFQGGNSIVVVHMFGLPLGTPAPTPITTPLITPSPVPAVAAAKTTPTPTILIIPTPAITPVAASTTTPSPLPTPEPVMPTVPENIIPPALLISPLFDQVDRDEIGAMPSFSVAELPPLNSVPSTIISISRKATAGILILVATLLTLATMIRIRIQHPTLITHASFVILLASVLLFA